MARVVVFVGPALRDIPVHPCVELRPPARRGDVLEAVDAGAAVVGLIDGLLVSTLAVTPRELRDCRARGARIVGGASLGALRAVECPDAVEGVGEVYAAFLEGRMRDDDELVGTFDGDYRYVAFPLVVIRDRISAYVDRQAIAAADADPILAAIADLPFYERTLDGIRRALADVCTPEAADVVRKALTAGGDDIKARDARLVIRRVQEIAGCDVLPCETDGH